MRIIGGILSGRRLEGSPGSVTRPTSARAREGLASALQARNAFEEASVLELFAGTGMFSFEALSRGAKSALCIDKSGVCTRSIEQNAELLGLGDRVRSVTSDLLRGPGAGSAIPFPDGGFTLVFTDPPYEAASESVHLLRALAESGAFAEGAWVAMEYPHSNTPGEIPGLATEAEYRYGDAAIRLMRYSMDVT